MKTGSKQTALLVMDMQTVILSNYPDAQTLITTVTKAIAHAREMNIPVIYVRVAFRPDAPEISESNKILSARKAAFASKEFAENWGKIHPALAPAEEDIVVTKRRFSAFTGSDLEVILRAMDIKHIVLTGVATSGVVLSTTREAADKDFQLTILADGCSDADPEVHRVLTGKIFPKQADVLTVKEWIEA